MTTSEKPNIVLDLDQTIIASYRLDEYKEKKVPEKYQTEKMPAGYIVVKRPGVDEFMDFLFKNFKVSVWTAATKDYALFIMDKIMKIDTSDRKIQLFFYTYHCNISEDLYDSSKNLKLIWEQFRIEGFSPKNTFIVDDYNDVHNAQKENCIKAIEFHPEKNPEQTDNFLPELQKWLETLILQKFQKGVSVQREIPKITRKFSQG